MEVSLAAEKGTCVSVAVETDVAVSVDGGLTGEKGEEFFADNHAVHERSEDGDGFLLADLDACEPGRQRVDDDVTVIEFATDGVRIVVTQVFAVDDVHVVVANVAFDMDLLRIRGAGRHAGGFVKDDLGGAGGKIGRRLTSAQLWVQSAEVSSVCGHINGPAETAHEFCIEPFTFLVTHDGDLVILPFTDI